MDSPISQAIVLYSLENKSCQAFCTTAGIYRSCNPNKSTHNETGFTEVRSGNNPEKELYT